LYGVLTITKELTFEEFCDLPFKYTYGLSSDSGASRLYRNDELKLQYETHTKLKKKGDPYSGWRKSVVIYSMDGDERNFETIDQLYVAYMEKVCQIETS